MTAQLDDAGTAAVLASVQLHRQARHAAWAAAREGFPPRPAAGDWPATRMSQDSVLDMLSQAPFTLPNPGTRRGQLRGVGLALAWLADQPGSTWQQRWLGSGAEAAGPAGSNGATAGWTSAACMSASGWICCRSG